MCMCVCTYKMCVYVHVHKIVKCLKGQTLASKLSFSLHTGWRCFLFLWPQVGPQEGGASWSRQRQWPTGWREHGRRTQEIWSPVHVLVCVYCMCVMAIKMFSADDFIKKEWSWIWSWIWSHWSYRWEVANSWCLGKERRWGNKHHIHTHLLCKNEPSWCVVWDASGWLLKGCGFLSQWWDWPNSGRTHLEPLWEDGCSQAGNDVITAPTWLVKVWSFLLVKVIAEEKRETDIGEIIGKFSLHKPDKE